MQTSPIKNILFIVLAFAALSTSLHAFSKKDKERQQYWLDQFGEVGRFKYGSTWWKEHYQGPFTALLLHFGRPQPYRLDDLSRQGLKRQKKEKKKERFHEMMDEGVGVEGTNLEGEGIGGEIAEEAEKQAGKMADSTIKSLRMKLDLKPVQEPRVPTDVIYDYSPARRKIPIKNVPGVRATPDGRFGGAIQFDGASPGIKTFKKQVLEHSYAFGHWDRGINMVELWMKVPSYPEKNACIFSAGGGEGRLMLRPDGRLEMIRLTPHGFPVKRYYVRRGGIESYKKIFKMPTDLVTENPIPTGKWTHVTVWRMRTLKINMQINYIYVNGQQAARWMGVPHDHYNMFHGHSTDDQSFKIGNDHQGKHPFKGKIDELLIVGGEAVAGPVRPINPPPPDYEWRDADCSRPLDFGKPFFYRNGHVFHIGFEKNLTANVFDGNDFRAELTHPLKERYRLFTDGIRGQCITIDPRISRINIPINDVLDTDEGSLEFWLRPVNWDNAGDRPQLPTYRIHLMRLHCETADGKKVVLPINGLPRRGEGGPAEFRPGKWSFFCMTWDHSQPPRSSLNYRIYRDPTSPRASGDTHRIKSPLKSGSHGRLKLKHLEIGVKKKTIAADGRQPIIQVDEIVGHDYALSPIEVYQARKRVQGRLERFKSLKMSVRYKYGLDELTGSLRCLFPGNVDPATATVTVLKEDGSVFAEPVTSEITYEEDDAVGNARFLLSTGKQPPNTPLTFDITVKNPQGEVVARDDSQTWTYTRRQWRGNTLGVPKKAPPPWTPVKVEGRTLTTRMTSYELGENGLPARIVAKGENLLARPVQLLEDGQPMKATEVNIGDSENTRAVWSVRFTGQTCNIDLKTRIEFDGLTRYEIDIQPRDENGKVAPIRFEIPLKEKHAGNRLFTQITQGRIKVSEGGPDVFTSRTRRLRRARWRARRRNNEQPTEKTFRTWDFWSIMDLCSRQRGLYWFADNAAGWAQTDRHPAQEFRRQNGEHTMVLNLVPKEMKYEHDRPIVFGMLPHPAKPLPSDYRYIQRAPSPRDEHIQDVYGSTFAPVPRSPKAGNTKVFPRKGSWEAAEKARPYLDMMAPHYRTMYLTLPWLSCRAGGYDHWKWRNGYNGQVSLCDSFIEYLCWEMDEWLKRGIYNAIYFDECYAWRVEGENAVKAGQAIRLPDGSIQPGMRLFPFRQLMKRWYQLFVKYDRRPMILSHHSRNWMYPGMVFCTSTLDGEGFPMVTVHGRRDFVDKANLDRLEVINNPHLWGTASFYMPSIWQLGWQKKGQGDAIAWQWRMARGAQSLLAHLENGTTFVDEGGMVYSGYAKVLQKWGALDRSVEFVPYYKKDTGIDVPHQGQSTLVSYYRDPDTNRILMIVSNLEKKKRRIKVTLDFDKLGLGDDPTMKVIKGAYQRPDGVDPWQAEAERPEANDMSLEDDGPEESDLDVELDPLKDEKEARKKRRNRPTLEGNVLTVPTRPHDYRVIALE